MPVIGHADVLGFTTPRFQATLLMAKAPGSPLDEPKTKNFWDTRIHPKLLYLKKHVYILVLATVYGSCC